MSTIVPNCTITYPKDLSRFNLNIDALTFPALTTDIVSIKLSILLDGNATSYSSVDITNIIQILTGNVDYTTTSPTLNGVGTLFLSELSVNDVVVTETGDKFVIESIIDDNNATAKSIAMFDGYSLAYKISNNIEILASAINGTTILDDGEYSFIFEYKFTASTITNSASPFTKYVVANQYNCVEDKLMQLALHCSEGCVDMEALKNTLLLKALLDAMEISINESDTATTKLIKDKINRYCLLLNNNCTSC